MKLRIESNGTPTGTFIKDADTGEDIGLPIIGIDWSIDVNTLPVASIKVYVREAELVGVEDAEEKD